MKIFHIADLHLGKRVNEYNMIDEQAYILDEILKEVAHHKPDALILAGDIYDRPVPSHEAVVLLDSFLNKLRDFEIFVYMISGNHDSRERLSFGSQILRNSNFFIEGGFKGAVYKHSLSDDVDVYLLPFIKPQDVRNFYEEDIMSYHAAVETVLKHTHVDKHKFNIVVAHQFITSGSALPELSESETVTVGGLDNIDASVFEDFDYVALGHIHKPQAIGNPHIRYAGSILKYSLSEVNKTKSITCLNIEGKTLELSFIELKPQKEMIHIKGNIDDILLDYFEGTDDFVYVTLTDENEIYDVIGKLRSKFPNLLNIRFENKRTSQDNTNGLTYDTLEAMTPIELFEAFFERQNNVSLNETQKEYVLNVMEEIEA